MWNKEHVLIYLLLLNSFSFNNYAQVPSIQWQKCIGGTSVEGLTACKQAVTSTDHFLCGATRSDDGNVSGNHGGNCPGGWPCGDAWLVGMDSLGNMFSQKCIGGTNEDGFESGLRLQNGNILFCGATSSDNGDVSGNHSAGTYDGWLVEADILGNIVRQHCYGGTDNDFLLDLKLTPDGGVILCGTTNSNDGDVSGNHGGTDIWIVKIDGAWNIQWQKCFGGSGGESAYDVYITNDGGYVCGGISNSLDGDVTSIYGMTDFWVLKIDNSGNKVWDKSLGGSQNDNSRHMVQASDDGYILTGETYSFDGLVSGRHDTVTAISDLWVVKIDSTGSFQWQNCLGGTFYDKGISIIRDYDSGFIITGVSNSNDGDVIGNHAGMIQTDDMWMVKIDSIGSLSWQKCFGGSDGEIGYSCVLTSDSGYVLTSNAFSIDGDLIGELNHGNGDAWSIKLKYIPLDAAMYGIIYPTDTPICDNPFSPKVRIKNNGFLPLTSVTVNYQVDNGVVYNHPWNGFLLQDSSTVLNLPAVTASAGFHTLSVFLTNPNGGIDENVLNDTMQQNFIMNQIIFSAPIAEGFELPLFPPPGWNFDDVNNIVMRTSAVSGFGNSTACLEANFYSVASSDVYLVSPDFDLTGLTPPVKVVYSIASAMKDSTSSQLFIFSISYDCGASPFQGIVSKSGSTLSTTTNTQNDFLPLPNEWRYDTIDLSPFIVGRTHLSFAMTFYTYNTNNIFIDDINIIDGNTFIQKPDMTLNQMFCYYNLHSGDINVVFSAAKREEAQLQLIDVVGKILWVGDFKTQNGINRKEISSLELGKGAYMVRLVTSMRADIEKIIVE